MEPAVTTSASPALHGRARVGGSAGARPGRGAPPGHGPAGCGHGGVRRGHQARRLGPGAAATRRRGRGGHGRRAGRLVRGHRPVPPPAGAADPPHRHRGRAQGPVRRHPGRVHPGELPDPRRDRGNGWRRPRVVPRVADWLPQPTRSKPPPTPPPRAPWSWPSPPTRRCNAAWRRWWLERLEQVAVAPLAGRMLGS